MKNDSSVARTFTQLIVSESFRHIPIRRRAVKACRKMDIIHAEKGVHERMSNFLNKLTDLMVHTMTIKRFNSPPVDFHRLAIMFNSEKYLLLFCKSAIENRPKLLMLICCLGTGLCTSEHLLEILCIHKY